MTSPDRAHIRTAGTGDERTNDEAIAPPTIKNQLKFISVCATSKHISLRELKQGRSNLVGGERNQVESVIIMD